jgi:hypothetical protein
METIHLFLLRYHANSLGALGTVTVCAETLLIGKGFPSLTQFRIGCPEPECEVISPDGGVKPRGEAGQPHLHGSNMREMAEA